MEERGIEQYKNKLQNIVDSFTQDPSINKDMKVDLVIHATSLICAIVAVQPIPFADIFVLTPIQLVMVSALNKILGNPFEKSSIKEVLSSLLVVVGWGTLAQHVILGLYKTIIPFLGGVTTIPLVYGATYALGTGAKILIIAKKNDRTVGDEELKTAMNQAKAEAERTHKKMSLSEALSQISEMSANTSEYEKYKNDMLQIHKQISSLCGSDLSMSVDIGKALNERMNIISKRMSKYKNITVSEYVLCIFSIIDSQAFIEVAEPIIGDINFQLQKMNLTTCMNIHNGRFYEIDTSLGSFLIKEKDKKEIVSLDLAVQYQNNPSLQYISPPQKKMKTLRDAQIRDVFYEMIENSNNTLDIVCPWVGKRPYEKVSEKLKFAASKGVKIRILYGINDSSVKSKKDKSDDTAIYINKYKEALGDSLRTKKTNTHVKLVICDGECFLLGSMNVLSFSGDYEDAPRLHSELATQVHNSEYAKELMEAYFNW